MVADCSVKLVRRTLACSGLLLSLLNWPATNKVSGQQANTQEWPEKLSTSFEDFEAGVFSELASPLGVWTVDKGRVSIDDRHAKTGKKCLHLQGGESTTLRLSLTESADTSGVLSFWAERWTRREPFEFLVEKKSGQGWQELDVGNQQVRVGRAFLSLIKIPLDDPDIKELRFTVTSPPKTGVLIDDLELAPARPQVVQSVEVVPFVVPALVGSEFSPLLKIKIETSGQLQPISVKEVQGSLQGTLDRADVEGRRLFLDSTGVGHFGKARNVAAQTKLHSESFVVRPIKASCTLSEGTNYLWIGAKIGPQADLDGLVGIAGHQLELSNGKTYELDSSAPLQRLGVAVRSAGQDDVNTYRIPGLVTTNAGSLIGVYDVRRRSGGDLPGDIDVGMSRSTDGGRTWDPMRVIMDMGDDPDWRYDGIGDPAVLVDRETGTIWVAATWSHGNRSWRGSGPGLSPEETGQLMLVRSDDDGLTWSDPINITSQIKRPEWCFILQGPGKGITMRDGTLVFAAQYQDPPENKRLPHSTIIYSKDHGETWRVGTGAFDDTTEAQVVELEPGVLMLNCRYNRKGVRVVMTTNDLGKTWQRHPTSERSLIEPGACMASLIRVDRTGSGDHRDWLLFSNPDSSQGRHHLTIKGSTDNGATWPKEHRLLLDEEPSAGYSCMTMIDADTVGILYEGSQAHMSFQRIPLNQLITQPNPPPQSRTMLELKMPRVFGDHMVLQSGMPIPVWGTAPPNRTVTVQWENEVIEVQADREGNWKTQLPAQAASHTPRDLFVRCDNQTIHFEDILIGEVWICAGQSNMAWPLRLSENGAGQIAQSRQASLRLMSFASDRWTRQRRYDSESLPLLEPNQFGEGSWATATPESAADFSAGAWHFGLRLQEALDVPVGLICPAVGGTPTESWIDPRALQKTPDTTHLVQGNWLDNERLSEFCRTRGEENLLELIQAGEAVPGDALGPNHPFKPGFMWQAGIAPLTPYAIRGVIWYQGESNAESPGRALEHGVLFPQLVRQWRDAWGQGSFPFLFVQLPAMQRPAWPLFRETQRRSLDQLEHVGMAVALDTGHPTNVHPPKKVVVGRRLARLALAHTPVTSFNGVQTGPLATSFERKEDSIIVTFRDAGRGIMSSDDEPLRHFELSDDTGEFFPAKARILDEQRIEVKSSAVSSPREIRYAWKPFPDPPVNLVNKSGLPASPFTSQSLQALEASAITRRERPNILLIVSEDNGDHLGCYGESRVTTPHLDRLAADGIRYTRAYVPYSVCSPSRAAFLTGLYPRQTGHIGLATHRFEMFRDFDTLPSVLKEAGYFVGFLGKTHINPARLVEDFVDYRAIPQANFDKRIGIRQYADEAEKVLQASQDRDQPFFLVVNYADAHRKFVRSSRAGFPSKLIDDASPPFPWIGSDTPSLRTEISNYLNCINRLDEGIGMLLATLDRYQQRNNTLIVYISDHGADFPRGKGSVYEHGVRIPMIIHGPRVFVGGKVESRLVSTLDLMPTILREAGVDPNESLPGIELQTLEESSETPRQYIHSFTTGSSPNLLYVQFGIRNDRYKLIYDPARDLNLLAKSRYKNSQLRSDQQLESVLHPPEFELYDLHRDPNEWDNLATQDEYVEIRQQLIEAMRSFQREISDPFLDPSNLDEFIEEQKRFAGQNYRRPDFQWPHLRMFKQAQKVSPAESN